jgi:hypothetical protein
MPILGGLLVTLFSAFASFFATFLTRKIAVAGAAVASLGTITLALLAVFNTQVAPLAAAVFSTQYGQFIGLAFPPMAGTCMASIGVVWSACTLYAWQRRAINLAAQS